MFTQNFTALLANIKCTLGRNTAGAGAPLGKLQIEICAHHKILDICHIFWHFFLVILYVCVILGLTVVDLTERPNLLNFDLPKNWGFTE